jgi:hypothetical protein
VDNGVDVAHFDTELEELATDYGTGRLTRREWLAAREGLEARKREALAEIETTENTRRAAARLRESGDVRKAWATASIEQRREVVRDLIERLTVAPTQHAGSPKFDPSRIDLRWRV